MGQSNKRPGEIDGRSAMKKVKEAPAVKTPSIVEESKESVKILYRVKLQSVKQNYIDYLESNFENKTKMLETANSQDITKFK